MKMDMRTMSMLFLVLLISLPALPVGKAEEPTLKIVIASPPQTLNVWSDTSTWTTIVLNFIYEPLAELDKDAKYVPWLAESWEASPDGKVWTVKLKKGIKWQDGQPLTAEDVKFTFEYFKKDVTARRGHSDMEYLDHVEVVDDYTLKIYLTEPFAAMVSTMLTNYVVPKHIWEPIVSKEGFVASKYEPKVSAVIGTGPFKVVEYKTNEYVKLVANENYWKGAPAVKKVVILFAKEADTQVLMLKKGEVDAAIHLAINPQVEPDLKAAGVKIHRYLRPYFYHWGFNLQHFPFTEPKFRKAVAYAINLSEIVEVARLGAGEPGSYGVLPPVWKEWYCEDAAKVYHYDPEKAKQLLNELGWVDKDGDGIRETPDDKEVAFEIYPPSYDPARVRAAEMIRDYLKEIGVKVTVQVGDWKGVVWPGIKGHKFDSFILGSSTQPDPDFMRLRFKTNASSNYYLLSDPELDKLLDEQAVTLDKTKRKEIVCQIQMKLADILPLITLYYPVMLSPYRTDKFEGWVPLSYTWIINRYTIINLKPKAATTTQQPTITETTKPTTSTAPQTTTTQPQLATTAPAEGGFPTSIVAAVVVLIIIIIAALWFLRRKS
ncbi:MAG: ABC transporter substrate-binding protein [Candidatus Korarchaeota archaeon]|nr:ABC transporter substrate-binding protein [Candidatus Korarchaeota archaeon]